MGGIDWRGERNTDYTVETELGVLFGDEEIFHAGNAAFKFSNVFLTPRSLRSFARAYVDDVVVYSRTLAEHVKHLGQVFVILQKHGISVNPLKAFLGYPSVQLLGQKVDFLGLSTAPTLRCQDLELAINLVL